MSKGIISFDCDGVLLDFLQGIIWYFEEEYPGIQLSHGNFNKWLTEEALGLDPATTQRAYEAVFKMSLRPHTGAQMVVDGLRSRGYELVVVTARDEQGWETALDDLGFHFNFFPSQIHFTQNKNAKLKELGALAHIDDKWKTAESIARMWEGSGKVSYLVDRPHNQSLDLAVQYKRIHSYLEVMNDWE